MRVRAALSLNDASLSTPRIEKISSQLTGIIKRALEYVELRSDFQALPLPRIFQSEIARSAK